MNLASWLLLSALAVHAGVHVALVVLRARTKPRMRGFILVLLPPLAPVWAWRSGHRCLAYVWAASLALYALGVAAFSM